MTYRQCEGYAADVHSERSLGVRSFTIEAAHNYKGFAIKLALPGNADFKSSRFLILTLYFQPLGGPLLP